jgi:hypothetical protein
VAFRLQNRAAMKRVLLVAALVLPQVALAVTPASGQLLDTTNYNATYAVSYINAAQCAGTDSLHLEWDIAALSGAAFAAGDVYHLYASNTAPTAGTSGGTFCAEQDNQTSGVYAGLVGSTAATTPLASLDVTGAGAWEAASADTTTCTSANEGATVYVCAHWYDAATTKKGSASGTFKVQVAAPPAPTGLTAPVPGNSSLMVSWTANPSTPTLTDHYVAEAFVAGTAPAAGTVPPFATSPVATATTNGTSATIGGLDNNTTYDVIVVAYSVGGNPSGASAAVQGQPVPTAGFWTVYKAAGGVEEGGCSTGAAGALSMLGAASLIAIRRRKR